MQHEGWQSEGMQAVVLRGLKEIVECTVGDRKPTREAMMLTPFNIMVTRTRTDLTRREFENYYGFASGSMQRWETGQKTPDDIECLVLTLINKHPELINSVIDGLSDRVIM